MFEDMVRKRAVFNYPTQYILLGQTYSLHGDYDKAIRAYQKSVRIKKENPRAHLFLGNAWFKKAVHQDDEHLFRKKICLRNAVRHYNQVRSFSKDSILDEWACKQICDIKRELETESRIEWAEDIFHISNMEK